MTSDDRLARAMEHLEVANRVRLSQAALKRDVKAGRADIRDLLLDPPPEIERIQIAKLLTWVPGVGWTRAEKLVKGVASTTLKVGHAGLQTRLQLAERIASL